MRDLDELRAFLAAVAAGSTQAAAAELGVPRSTVRRRIASLEGRLGVALLWNDASGTHLTPAGRLVVEDSRALLESYEALLATARQAARRPAKR